MRRNFCSAFRLFLRLATTTLLLALPNLGAVEPDGGAAQRAIVIGTNVPLRTQPHRLAEVVLRLTEGDFVQVVSGEQQGNYLRIHAAEGSGWVHNSTVRRAVTPLPPATSSGLSENIQRNDASRRSAAEERHFAAGKPIAVYERYRDGYTVGVDARLRIPLWVQYKLTRDDLSGPGDRDGSRFAADQSLPQVARAELRDYRGSGFDRGHMAPAGDMKRTQAVMDESFLLSNITPQVGLGFNRQIWRLLEEAVRDWTLDRGIVTVITGPIFAASSDGVVSYEVLGENQVAVPSGFFKIVFDEQRSETLAFHIPNEPLFDHTFGEFLVSIDSLEAQTGLDFLSALPEEDQQRLESDSASRPWRIGSDTRRMLELARADVQLRMVDLDEQGRFVNAGAFDALIQHARDFQPTHLFLLAHGWNNNRRQAETSYQAVLSLMGDVADRTPGLRPDLYRPLVIGVHWPSKAWDEQTGRVYSLGADEDLTLAIVKVLPSQRAPETYAQDVQELREMLSLPQEQLAADDRRRAWQLLRKYASEPQMAEDESIFDRSAVDAETERVELGSWSVADLFRAFTFWEMKKRAGEVGGRGGGDLLRSLMAACPVAQTHLGGHSFGCKFWLAALTDGPALPRRVESVALVQGAVSSWAFADRVPGTSRRGGYREALSVVSGPIVATYSSQDWPLRFVYPLGSRLAGQTGELERAARDEPPKYAALGATGAADIGRTIRLDGQPLPVLQSGFWSVDGSDTITGHSEFYVPEVASLLWTAIRAAD